jgi:hypothetical protein
LDSLKERRGYSHLKEKALDRNLWRARFGRGFGPFVRQTTKLINESYAVSQWHWTGYFGSKKKTTDNNREIA